MVKKILSIREELESHKTRRPAFSGIEAEVIHWELKQRKVCNVASIPTIANILSRHGKTGKVKNKSNGNSQPYLYIKAEKMGDLHQTDLVGPRHLRGQKGIARLYSFYTADVAGHAISTSQFSNKQTISLCRHLIEAWRLMGLPEVSQKWIMRWLLQVEGGYLYSISQVIWLHLLLGVHLVFIPQGEPSRSASIESFNDLWQERVLRRHDCLTLLPL